MMKVGIPRALLYYQYFPLWQAFFRELGAEVVVSPPTTQATVSAGSSRVTTDTCLPVKVFCGHVMALRAQCDCLFIPVVRSTRHKVYNCAKFLGLPDMTRAVIPEAPPILDIDVDINRGQREFYQAIYRLGRHFTWNPLRIRKAALAALDVQRRYQQMMSAENLTPPRAIARLDGQEEKKATDSADAIALIGHPYLLYDEHVSHRLLHRLEQAGVRVLTPEMLTRSEREQATARLVGGAYWTYEDEVVGAGGHYLSGGVAGIIGIMAFGCGPDSLMMDMVRRAARASPGAFMCLTLEEHTAEAGVLTRLEAFLDMLRRRRKQAICA